MASSSRPKRRKLTRWESSFYPIPGIQFYQTNLPRFIANVEIAKTETLGLKSPAPHRAFVFEELAIEHIVSP
jgi:hypothetical protein